MRISDWSSDVCSSDLDALIPLEQFALGGPDSTRAYPIADALRDRGYYTSLEYHVDAPGFGDKVSPFYGRPWRELLEFQVFVDYAKGYSAGANKRSEEHTSELQSLMRISYAVFCLKKKNTHI